jgi:hypothetical protein
MREEKLWYMEQDQEWTTISSKNHRSTMRVTTKTYRPTIQIYRPCSEILAQPNPLTGANTAEETF